MNTVNKLLSGNGLSRNEIASLLSLERADDREGIRRAAYEATTALSGDRVFLRGLLEFSNICKQDCCYCGIRRSNKDVERYQLEKDVIVDCALWAALQGYGSCVIQAGERQDEEFIAFVEECVRAIKAGSCSEALPDGLGITLSLGDQDQDTYRRWFDAGAHRYLLRIETSNPDLFAQIHPPAQSYTKRLESLKLLKEIGYQVGTGVMMGLPGQTLEDLAGDIVFFKEWDVDMIGMGPYIVHPQSPMAEQGMTEEDELLRLSLNMIAVTRLLLKDVNIAATTAMQTIAPDGREQAIASGANVVMPSLTPTEFRKNYLLYSGKPCLDENRLECRNCLENRIEAAGRRIGWNEWGDSPRS